MFEDVAQAAEGSLHLAALGFGWLVLKRFEPSGGDGSSCLPLIGCEISLRRASLGKRIVKLAQEFPRSHRGRRTWLEAPEHVLQPTDHAAGDELFGGRGPFGLTGHDPDSDAPGTSCGLTMVSTETRLTRDQEAQK
jgi:hypothetical protein